MEGRMVERKNSKRAKAQVTLELAFAIMAIVILLMGAIKLFIWFNQRFIFRQGFYERTRTNASWIRPGRSDPLRGLLKSDLPEENPTLDFFGEGEKK